MKSVNSNLQNKPVNKSKTIVKSKKASRDNEQIRSYLKFKKEQNNNNTLQNKEAQSPDKIPVFKYKIFKEGD